MRGQAPVRSGKFLRVVPLFRRACFVRLRSLVRVRIDIVMPGPGPGIHALATAWYWGKDVEDRDKPGHDVRLFAVDPSEAVRLAATERP